MNEKEKFEEAKRLYQTANADQRYVIETLFPELKESEDERIRKEIIATIHLYYGEPLEDEAKEMIAWLEKQEGCEYIKKDWLEHIKQSWYKEGFIDGKYSGGASKEWTTNDAAIFKEIIDSLENGTAKLQHDLTKYANWLKIRFTPIEKQGESELKDNKDEKIRKKIIETFKNLGDGKIPVDINYADIFTWLEKQGGQKFAWSEEDEKNLQGIIDEIQANKKNAPSYDIPVYEGFLNWLKSLKPQKQWKPSNEQIEALENLVRSYGESGTLSPYDNNTKQLYSLLYDLKNLNN